MGNVRIPQNAGFPSGKEDGGSGERTGDAKMTRIEAVARAEFPTQVGQFWIFGFKDPGTGDALVVLTCGNLAGDTIPYVRIHSQCLTGDTLGSLRCDCGYQLHESLRRIQSHGCGLLIYQPSEGRGIGILNKLKAYELQDQGLDTVEANQTLGFEADLRTYESCAAILAFFGIRRVHLLSNNPDKISSLESCGIQVVSRVPLEMPPGDASIDYLRTKKNKLGHLLDQI